MKLTADIHLHTDYSHGLNTVEDMIKAAHNKGLKEIHITEHSYAHYYARKLNREKYRQLKARIDAVKEQYPDMKILFGAEANVYSVQGDIDIKPQDMDLFEVVNVGFHVMCGMKNLSSYFKIHLLYVLAYKCKLKCFEKASVRYCTQAILGVLDRYKINMITHPMSNYRFDLVTVAEKCARTGTILEINNSRGKLNAQEVESVKHLDVRFAVGSDAHKTENVGRCETAFEIIKKSGLDLNKLVNVE